MTIKVLKSSGIAEDFDAEKLRKSLLRSGANHDQAEIVIRRVIEDLQPHTTTKQIYRAAKKELNRLHHASGLRYSLKKAIFRLGPTGFPFEKYIGEILRNHGYKVKVGTIVAGACVSHEVDVFAQNEREISVMECKYHNSSGKATDVKVSMYVHSRVLDLKPTIMSGHKNKSFNGWIVTNTRCTSEAIRFAECTGLKIMSWRYPKEKSLENIIEKKRLYPVTIISGIQAGLAEKLISHDVVLLKDLLSINVQHLQKMLSLNVKKALSLKKQAEELCLCEDWEKVD